MKINDSQRMNSLPPYRSAAPSASGRSVYGGKGARDDIRISSEAKELLELQRMEQANRAQHIEELKSSVREGTYQVSAERVAEKLWPFLK